MRIKKTLINLTAPELVTKAADLRRQITKLKLEKSVGKNRNVRQAFMLKKQLAITQTLIHKT